MTQLIIYMHVDSTSYRVAYLVAISYDHVISTAAHRTEELSIPVSSSPPHFTLRWLQNAMPRTPALFISDIALMGSGGPGNKCKLDKVIDFSSDG